MDIGTVIQIIEMLDARIENNQIEHCNLELFMISHDEPAFLISKAKERYQVRRQTLVDFRDYLQEYIESQVNQLESEMNRGE